MLHLNLGTTKCLKKGSILIVLKRNKILLGNIALFIDLCHAVLFKPKQLVKHTIVVYTWKPLILYSGTNQPHLNELKWFDLLDREKNCGRENQLVIKGSVDTEIMFVLNMILS